MELSETLYKLLGTHWELLGNTLGTIMEHLGTLKNS